MPAPTITALPPAPQRTDAPATFTPMADAFAAALGPFGEELNALATYLQGITGSAGPINATALTMNTARILGRTSADAGAIEEITIGAGLSLSGGSLAVSPVVPTTQSGTSYTAALSDAGGYIRFDNAAAVAFTLPPAASVAFALGTVITVEQAGAGAVTITAGAGVTINSRAALVATAGQFAVAQVKLVAADTWTVIGDVA